MRRKPGLRRAGRIVPACGVLRRAPIIIQLIIGCIADFFFSTYLTSVLRKCAGFPQRQFSGSNIFGIMGWGQWNSPKVSTTTADAEMPEIILNSRKSKDQWAKTNEQRLTSELRKTTGFQQWQFSGSNIFGIMGRGQWNSPKVSTTTADAEMPEIILNSRKSKDSWAKTYGQGLT